MSRGRAPHPSPQALRWRAVAASHARAIRRGDRYSTTIGAPRDFEKVHTLSTPDAQAPDVSKQRKIFRRPGLSGQGPIGTCPT
jgi:hypothetical protein